MSASHTPRKVLAFFRRDLGIARSYRGAFLVELGGALLGVAPFYYLSRLVGSEEVARMLPQGTDYFAFVLVGLAFFDYLGVSLVTFEASLQEARENGTLEALLVTQTTLPTVLIGSCLYPFVVMAVRTLAYLAWGIFMFKFPVQVANWFGAAIVLLTSILAFAGLGVFSASYVLLFKRGNPTKWAIAGIAALVSGVMYPVSILPDWLQIVARLIPVTYSLEAMRAALLGGASLGQLWPVLRALLIFAAILLPLSFTTFAWALRRTKVTGTLTHF